MKEYKYKINGNIYKVAVGDIDNNFAEVEVNGVPYKVELDQAKKPVTIINAPRPSAAPRHSGFSQRESWRCCQSLGHSGYS